VGTSKEKMGGACYHRQERTGSKEKDVEKRLLEKKKKPQVDIEEGSCSHERCAAGGGDERCKKEPGRGRSAHEKESRGIAEK